MLKNKQTLLRNSLNSISYAESNRPPTSSSQQRLDVVEKANKVTLIADCQPRYPRIMASIADKDPSQSNPITRAAITTINNMLIDLIVAIPHKD